MRISVLSAATFLLLVAGPVARGGEDTAAPPATGAADAEAVALTPDETNAWIDSLFARHEKLERISANVTKVKQGGGTFRRAIRKSGPLQAELPNRLVWDMRESDEPLFILADGTYAWVYDPILEDVERWKLDEYGGDRGQFDLAALFLGTDVKTAEELRRNFAVTAFRKDGFVHLTLLPEQGPAAEKYQRIQLTFADAGLLPRQARLVGKAGARADEEPPVTMYEIRDLKTNLDGLEGFGKDVFVFPLSEEMTVSDMTESGGRRPVSVKSLMRERAAGKASEATKEGDS